jgi:hypothetical protein
VRNDDNWQEWDFPKLVEALRKWTERNPLQIKYHDNKNDSKFTYRKIIWATRPSISGKKK